MTKQSRERRRQRHEREREDRRASRTRRLRDLGIEDPRPFLYYVVADLPDAPRSNVPVISEEPDLRAFRYGTYPHQFDTHLAPALPALAYVLNLPRAPLDLFRTTQDEVPLSRPDWHFHTVYVLPVQNLRPLIADWAPALIIAPDAFIDAARQLASATGALLGAVGVGDLSAERVARHWQELWEQYCDPARFVPVAPRAAVLDVSRMSSELPDLFPARASGQAQHLTSVVCPGVGGLYKRRLKQRVLEADAEVEAEVEAEAEAEAKDGPIDFRRRVEADRAIERDVFSLVATHSALRHGGEAMLLPELPGRAFGALVRAERGFAAKQTNPPQIWRSLETISDVFRQTVSPEDAARIESAWRLKVFANFPLGLADPGSRGTPLALRTPIAYVPLNPLTHNLTYEYRTTPYVSLHGERPRVVFAECIPADDPVGHLSRAGTARIVSNLKRTARGRLDVEVIDVPDVDTLRAALRSSFCHVLVLSAHGASDPVTGASGIIVGDRLVTGYELERPAAVVILSACRVSPKGVGTMSIVDELLNIGALAVAGTMVPICVHRNTMLLERLLTLLAQWTAGSARSNFLEIWWAALHYTSAMDIVLSDAGMTEWIFGEESTYREVMGPVFEDLASAVSGSAVRSSAASGSAASAPTGSASARSYDFYGRAFHLISEAGRRHGREPMWHECGQFVVPESLMYMIFGWPENILV